MLSWKAVSTKVQLCQVGYHCQPRKGLCIIRGETGPEFWELCVEFIQSPCGDLLSLLHPARLCDHTYLFLLVCLEESVLWARTSAYFL